MHFNAFKASAILAQSFTIFPCYLGMEFNNQQTMQRPNEQQQRLSSWAI